MIRVFGTALVVLSLVAASLMIDPLLSGRAAFGQVKKNEFDERAKFLRSTAIGAISSGRHEDAVAPLKRLLENYPDAYQKSV